MLKGLLSRLTSIGWQSFFEACHIYWTLFKLAFPLLCAIKILDDAFGIIALLGEAFAPLMSIVNLPGDTGIIFATAILVNIYTAILVAVSLWTALDLTTAQATILMTMALVAHALPVELRIAQQAGMRIGTGFLVRLGGAFMLGWLLSLLYGDTWLNQPAYLAAAMFSPPPITGSWEEWFGDQSFNWLVIFLIVQSLVLFINILKAAHIERFFSALLAPVFRRIGIGEKATTMAMIGLLLGLSYGGGLLIRETRSGAVSRRDALCALALISLCHSVIEDTLLVMLVGAHWSGVLVGRVVFALVFMFAFARVIHNISDTALDKIAVPRRASA